MTETDGFDVRTSTSAEANKIEQIEARARSFPLRQRRIFKECTLTTADGHTWQKYQAGTRSKIVLPCPHCQAWVTLERENFTGWQNAASDVEAVDNSKFSCSCCGKPWSESERAEANDKSKLLHRGQRIEDGKIVGEAVATYTLGFRWSAVNNMLVPAADVAADEYAAKHAIDEDDAQRKLSQFVWAVPYEPAGLDDINLTASEIKERQTSAGRGVVPEDTRFVTIGIDVNKTMLHWVAIAWRPDDVGHVIDYGRVDPDWKGRAWNVAFRECLEGLYKSIGQGWTRGGFNRIHIDSRWQTTDVIRAIKSLKDPRVRPFMGLGLGHWKRGVASDPTKLTRENIWAGDRCYERVNAVHQAVIMFADSNYWKTWLHSRLLLHNSDGVAVPGQITLFGSMDPAEHDTFARQLTAEKEVLLFERGKGHVKQWEAIRSANHYLDAAYMACVGGCRLGVGKPSPVHRGPRMMEQEASPKAEDVKRRPAMRSRGFTSAGNGFRSGNFHRR